jgi:GAF domain-containing protein/nitrogen-specific signal transduction histidine kinase
MDAMTASTPIYGWELLAQLAQYGQQALVAVDPAACARTLAELLGRYVPDPGRIELVEDGITIASAAWGEPIDDPAPLALRGDNAELGWLHLGGAGAGSLDPHFAAALTAQLSLLLLSRQRAEAAGRANDLQALVANSLEQVGVLDTRTLLSALLTQALPALAVESVAIYSREGADTTLSLVAQSETAFTFTPNGLADDHIVVRAVATGAAVAGRLAPAVRRRTTNGSNVAREALALPLVVQEQPLGALALVAAGGRALRTSQRRLAERFAQQLTILLRNAQLFSQQQQRARELFVLYENSQAINSAAQIESMLNRSAENIALALTADYCAILLIDQHAPDRLRTVALYNETNRQPQAPGEGALALTLPVALLAQAARSEAVQLDNLAALASQQPLAAALVADGCAAALLVPMKGKDQLIGVLAIGYAYAHHVVSQAERNLAQVLAAQVATAVETRRLAVAEQQRAAELELLQQISQSLNAELSLDETYEAILDGVQALMKFSGARIMRYAPRLRTMSTVAACGLLAGAGAPGDALNQWLARHQRPLRLADLRQLPAELTGFTPPQLADASAPCAYIGVPMRVGDELIGALELFSSRVNAFSADDERLLSIIAGQSAQAITNASRYEQADSSLRTRVEQLRALQRVSSQLAITLNQEEILAYVLEQALRVTGATHGLIALRIAQDERYEGHHPGELARLALVSSASDDPADYLIVELVGYPEPARSRLLYTPLEEGVLTAQRALQRREPELSDSLEPAEQQALHSTEAVSALAAPIFYQAGVAGVLLLLAPVPHAFDHDAVEFLRALTHQAAVGIGNAQRYADLEHLSRMLQRRADILNDVLEIGQALRADRSLANLLEQVGYSAMESADYRTILFLLADADHPDRLRPHAAAGIPLNELSQMAQHPLALDLAVRYLDPQYRIGRSYFIPVEVAATFEREYDTAVFTYSSFADQRAPGEWQHGDRLCVPLYSTEGNMLGLMMVSDPLDRRRPTARSVEPLEIFADQAAIAIENHLLLDDARARAEQQGALFRVGTAATSTTDIDTLLEGVYQEIVSYLDTPSYFYVASYLPEREQVRFELFMRQGDIVEAQHKALAPKDGLMAQVLDSGRYLLVSDLAAQPELRERNAAHFDDAPDVRSWLGVPLISQGRTIGVLSVQDYRPHAFSERDLQFFTTLASQLAIALENARLFNERERRIAELNVINRIGQVTASTLDLRVMLREVYRQLADFLSLDSFFIFVYEAETNEITLSFQVDEGVEQFDASARAPRPDSLTAQIIATRRPLQFVDLSQEAESQGYKPVPFGSDRRSAAWLGVPLLVGDGSVVGVIGVMSYSPGVYGERERSFMTTVANQLALGVQNARLLARAQAQVDQLALLNRVAFLANTSTTTQQIYQVIVDAMYAATGVDQARLVIYDRAQGIAPAVAEAVPSGVLESIIVPIANSPSVDWLDKHRTPLIAEDAQRDPRFVLSHETFRELDIRSIALVPLVVDDVVIGAVGLDFVGRAGTFSIQAVELCQTIANQTATAIARAQNLAQAQANAEQIQVRFRQLSTLLDAARILSSLLRPQEVLDKLMELVSRQLNVTTVALWTIGDDQILTPAALSGIPSEQGRTMRVPVGEGLTGRVAAQGAPLVIDDANLTGGSLYPGYQRDNNLIAYMGVPVVYRERTIGVLSVMTDYPRIFSDDEILLLVGLADQAATALENARLFEERERRINELQTFNRISQAVNATLDQTTLLEKLHAGIGEVIDVSTSGIALYDEASDLLHYAVAYDQGERITLEPIRVGNDTSGWAVRNRKPLLIHSDVEARSLGLDVDGSSGRVGAADRAEQSYLVTPIIFGSRVLGVINIQSYDTYAFDENDLRFVTTVANQAAVALNNAMLFSETRQNAAEMTTLFEVTQNLSGTLDPDEAQHLVADAALRLIGAEFCVVLSLDRHGRFERQVFCDRSGFRDDLTLEIRSDGLTAQLLTTDQPVAIVDLANHEQVNPNALALGVRSALGIVIGSLDEQLGVLWIGASRPYEWSEHETALLRILANQASQALKSARLFQLEQQRRRLADTLRDVARSFTSALALREIQTLILDQLARVVDYDSAAVLLRDAGYGHLQITEARGLDRAAILSADFEVEHNDLFRTMALERGPLLIQDTTLDERFEPLQRLGWQPRSWIGAPLLVDNELVGILTIGARTPGAYDAEAVEVTFALASQASQAIQNARLFDQISNLAADLERRVSERTAELEQATRQLSEEKDRLEAVHAITLELTTQLDLDLIISRALELISRNVGVSRGSIMLRDTERGDLIVRAVLYDHADVRPANIPLRFEGSESLAGWVIQHQESVNIPDVLQDARWVQEPGRADQVRSVAAVPLKTSDIALGVLVLSSPEVGYFTDSQMNLLGTIASVVAAAVSNAQLYSYINDLASNNAALLAEQREETSKSAAVFRSVTEGVIVLDTDRQVTLFNPAAEQVLEIPAIEVLGRPLTAMGNHGASEVERKRAQTILQGLLNGLRQVEQSQRTYSTSVDLSDPNQVIAVNLAPVVGPDGQRYGDVAVLRDITREIEADQAKRQFVSDVSHELRTPLTAIKGYVDVLLLGGATGLSDDQVSYLNIIRNNTNRLKALIEDILEFERPDDKRKLNFSPVEIPAVLREVIQSLRLEYERKGMEVTLDAPDTLPPVIADQKRLTQVVNNLFSNAVKYTFEGGKIQVRAFLNRANMLQVDVADNGVGMSPEQRKKLFRPFYRADNPLRDVAGGTGLGLAIAKSLVEQHGGEMWVTSELGKGSTFSFIVPLEQNEANDNGDEDEAQ